jgi:hypothetical protein
VGATNRKRSAVHARRFSQFRQRYELNPIAISNAFQGRKHVRSSVETVGKRDGASVVGAKSVIVYLKTFPRRDGAYDATVGLPQWLAIPPVGRSSPRVEPQTQPASGA